MTVPRLPFGSRFAELDRTAEMVVELCQDGKVSQAIWLIYDSNRFDADSMRFLAERVQAHEEKK